MRKFLLTFMLLACTAGSFAWADDVTDALLGVDPRLKLESGRGSVLGNAYEPKEDEQAPAEELNAPLDESASANRYAPYDGLRSPLFDSSPENQATEENSLPHEHLSLPEASTLGKPDARDGVWYGDDLNK